MQWIEELNIKRRSLFSTVILVESDDRERERELLTHLRDNPIINGEREILYLFDNWKGLYRFPEDGNGQPEPVTAQGGGGLMAQVTGQTGAKMPLPTALTTMDSTLKSEKTVLVISGLIEQDNTLNSAIKSLSQDDIVFNTESTIIVIVSDLSIIPQHIRALCSIVNPPTSITGERKAIIEKLATTFKVSDKLDINNIVDLTSGMNLTQVEATVLESIYRTGTVDKGTVTKMKAEIIQRSGVLEVDMAPKFGFESVGGYEVIKDFIKRSMVEVYQNSEIAKTLGLPMPRGLLLFGMGGTGKTILAKAIAKEMNLPFVRVRFDQIYGGIVGETEKNLAMALRIIDDMSPCLVFIDEIDQLGSRGDTSTDSGVTRRLFSRLLEWLGEEDRTSVIIGATNRPEYLDEAFIRVGRFDYIIPQLLPNTEGRKAILKVHTEIKAKIPLSKDVDFDTIANDTELWTGAELRELVIRAVRKAFDSKAKKVTLKHFAEALNTFAIDRKGKEKSMTEYLNLAKKLTNDTQFLEALEVGYRKALKTKAELMKK